MRYCSDTHVLSRWKLNCKMRYVLFQEDFCVFFEYTESGLSEITSLKSPLLNSYGFKHFRKEKIYVRGLDRDRKYFHTKCFSITSIDNHVNEIKSSP